jgi:hypothetical protein
MKIKCALLLIFLSASLYANVNNDFIAAASKGKLKEAQKLVGKGANINFKSYQGKTALHWAVLSGNLKMVVYLIGKGADVNAKDRELQTPLHNAAIKRDIDILKYLVLKGADINTKDINGWTPLHYFSYYENSIGVKYLIVQGVDLSIRTTRKFMDIQTNSSALDIAALKNNSNIILALENPEKYLILSKKPFLFIQVDNRITSNILIAPAKDVIQIIVENRGGYAAENVEVVIEKVSNCDGLESGTNPSFYLGPGQRRLLDVPIIAGKFTRDTTAFFHIFAKEANSFRESNLFPLSIKTLSPQPPSFIFLINSEETNKPIEALEERQLKFSIENKGLGYAENARLFIEPLNGCSNLLFSELSNLYFVPGEKKDLFLKLKALEDLKDGNADFKIIVQDPVFYTSVTNFIKIQTKKLLKPFLTVEMTIQTIVSNSITNSSWVVVLKNRGEAAVKNVSIIVKVENSNVSNAPPLSFLIGEIRTNGIEYLKIPVEMAADGKTTYHISGSDEKKWSVFDTNLVLTIPK